VVPGKVAKRKAIQVPTVGWVTVRAEISVVRRDDQGSAAWYEQPMEFIEGTYYVGDVLNDVSSTDFAE
jgi:hypothetical protein